MSNKIDHLKAPIEKQNVLVMRAVKNHDWRSAQISIDSGRISYGLCALTDADLRDLDLAEVHFRVTRSYPTDIERGLEITAVYPRKRVFKIWREVLLAQKMTLWELNGKKQKEAKEYQQMKSQRAKILDSLRKSATDGRESDRWECKLAILLDKEIDGWFVSNLLTGVEELKGTTTSQEMTTLADYAITRHDRTLAGKLLEAQPYEKARDGSKSSWTTESDHLTPYNRRGHLLAIIVRGLNTKMRKKITKQFKASQKLGCMNECRSMALALWKMPDAGGPIGLGRQLASELGFSL